MAQTAGAAAGTDAGYPVLPETVSVLPQPSNPAYAGGDNVAGVVVQGQMVATASAQGGAPAVAAQTAAFAGPTPQAVQPAGAPITAPAGLAVAMVVPEAPSKPATGVRGEIDKLIDKYAAVYEVPVDLVRHVVNRESTFNPRAYNRGHWGLMQIKHATARGMGYGGPASGLFDAETNLKYAVKYLRGAWLVSDGNPKRADRLYQTGYYYEAKRKGMLEATGLGVDRKRRQRGPAPAIPSAEPEA
ncbi:lytic transglycosylase domain-containing protein [Mesorhizobium sp. BE184]|uniref:lytic transglycosylase domain-containing protein n=1 Tax=Mesorhizobium sp. BE184 TaxID=2817714 RepID=UPI0028635099|nr:lytic transglycosylase domain-containing protein [Mesorhizobium sp. BE184]MDR7034875.1 soluble lytic murein transglycosylase-like protein [Mesorhizobium sp. BE184]